MRMTTDEILEQIPSMNFSGKHADTVQGRYYGDLPIHALSTEFAFPDDQTLCNLEAVDVFIARCYTPETVDKYQFRTGEGYKIRGGRVIAGQLNVRYRGGWPYIIELFNNHVGQYGFWIGKPGTGKHTYVSYETPGFSHNPWSPRYQRDVIDVDTIEQIFQKVERDDEFGEFARLLVKTAREIWADVGKDV